MASIPGLEHLKKDGWEIVGFDYVSQEERFVDHEGRIVLWGLSSRSSEKKIIVRKVQHPYRLWPKPAKQNWTPMFGDVVWVRAKVWDRSRHPDRLMLEVGNGEIIAGESDCKPYAEPDLKQAIREVMLSKELLEPLTAAFSAISVQAIAKAVADELRLNPQQISRTTKKHRPLLEPSKKTPPALDYRLLGPAKDEPRIVGDYYWSLRNKTWMRINAEIVNDANRDNWTACRKIETPVDDPAPWTPKVGDWVKVTKPVDCAPAHKIWWVQDMDEFDGKVMQVTSVNPQSPWANLDGLSWDFDFAWLALATDPRFKPAPKRYREPTPEDLKNGPIECEVGDNHEKRTLVYVFDSEPGLARFVAVDKAHPNCVGRWIDCRIEVK